MRNLSWTMIVAVSLNVGCSRFGSFTSGDSINAAFFTPGDTALNPPSDKLATDCRTNAAFDACVVRKNPVAQNLQPTSVDTVDEALRFGVKIHDLVPTGFLENARVQILTLHSARLSSFMTAQFKAKFSADQSYAEQVMSYYWANRALDYFTNRVGAGLVPSLGLKIYVDDTFTGFSSTTSTISLEKIPGQLPKAFSAEILIHLIGEALAQSLSGGKLFDRTSLAQHNFCNLNPKGCCSSEIGCSQALGSAFGDYVAAMVFPDSPRLGESVAQNQAGQVICGLHRDLTQLNAKTKTEMFTACTTHPGQVTLLGAWYAALWWKARTAAEAQAGGASQDIDILFFQHAQSWQAGVTFADAETEALNLAAKFKSGIYVSLLQKAFAQTL